MITQFYPLKICTTPTNVLRKNLNKNAFVGNVKYCFGPKE